MNCEQRQKNVAATAQKRDPIVNFATRGESAGFGTANGLSRPRFYFQRVGGKTTAC